MKSSAASPSLILDIEDFKGDFSFDALFGGLLTERIPSYQEDRPDAAVGQGGPDSLPNATLRGSQGRETPMFPAVEELLSLFKDSFKELVDLRQQIDGRLLNLKKDVEVQDSKHRKMIAELEKGVDGLHQSFQRLDSRISSVGQTAAKIGDHLQSADSQRKTAIQTIELVKYLMEFNSSPGDLMELSSLFSDDSRVSEAASIAQKLRTFAEEDTGPPGINMPAVVDAPNASRGLEVAVANLQDYLNELENRLLTRFDGASQRRDMSSMAECAKILSQFNRGTSAMQHYVASRPMFIDVDIMNRDISLILGKGLQAGPSYISHGLSIVYKEITDTVTKEAETIRAVFPSPNDVMAILVQRVLEQRVSAILDRLLQKPLLGNLPPVSQGGLLLYLRIFAVAYEKTDELAKELQSVGCGDLDAEGLTESLFLSHKDEYPDYEQASLKQLYQSKMEELRAEALKQSDSTGTTRSKTATGPPNQQISVDAVSEFVQWNEEAITRCTLFSSQPTILVGNIRSGFACILKHVSQYLTDGLERAREGLTEAAALRDRFVIGASASKRAAAAEAAATAGETSFRLFMIAVQRSASSVAILQQYFSNTISRLLPPDAHAASLDEMATAVSRVESAAQKGLQQCIDTVLAEVERLLSSEQKTTDYRTPDDGGVPDYRSTPACLRVTSYLSRVLESAFTALEGLNKQSFLTELGNRFYKALTNHLMKFTFNASGGLRLKRDITDYGDLVHKFSAPSVEEKFELLGIVANAFIVAPESLASLFEGTTPSIKKDALRFIQLREDYKTNKIGSMLTSLVSDAF